MTASRTTNHAELWQRSALELAAGIRARTFSAREVVGAHLARIAQTNAINAVTVVLSEDALAAADRADTALARNEPIGPLHGVPYTVKENIDLVGSASSQGVPALERAMPAIDAPHIAHLRAAGAIAIGRTNLPEFGLRWHTDNALRGATRNPWNDRVTTGGSSGGDAAALATGMTPLGCGNDYGGSLRVPSAFCGTTALRPTHGRVPFASALDGPPPSITLQLFAVQGPMARRVADLDVTLSIMSGASSRDAWWTPAQIQTSPLRRVAVCREPGGRSVHPDVAAGIERAADALRDAGYVVADVDPPDLVATEEAWLTLVNTEIAVAMRPGMDPLMSNDSRRFLDLMLSWAPQADLATYMRLLAERSRHADAWRAFMANHPVVLGPVSNAPPFEVGADIRDVDSNRRIVHTMNLTTSVNMLGLPSVAVPVGVANGLPQGVQLIADRYHEGTALAAAAAIEARVGLLTPIDPR
jgi:amidase